MSFPFKDPCMGGIAIIDRDYYRPCEQMRMLYLRFETCRTTGVATNGAQMAKIYGVVLDCGCVGVFFSAEDVLRFRLIVHRHCKVDMDNRMMMMMKPWRGILFENFVFSFMKIFFCSFRMFSFSRSWDLTASFLFSTMFDFFFISFFFCSMHHWMESTRSLPVKANHPYLPDRVTINHN